MRLKSNEYSTFLEFAEGVILKFTNAQVITAKALRLNINVETTPCLQYYTSGSNFKHYSRKPLWGYSKGHWLHITKDLYLNYKFCSLNPLVIHSEVTPSLKELILKVELKSIAI